MSWVDRYKEEKIVVQQVRKHNKFWAAHYDESTGNVYVRWGRLGTKGQSQVKSFGSSTYAAADFISGKYQEKRRKGYTDKDEHGNTIDHARFEMMCTEAAIVGTQNKCHNLSWVELTEKGADSYEYEKISDERLYAPDCNPGLLVDFETKKAYDGRTRFTFLFTFENTFDVGGNGRAIPTQLVTSSHPLHGMTTKVEEAIGRRLAAA